MTDDELIDRDEVIDRALEMLMNARLIDVANEWGLPLSEAERLREQADHLWHRRAAP